MSIIRIIQNSFEFSLVAQKKISLRYVSSSIKLSLKESKLFYAIISFLKNHLLMKYTHKDTYIKTLISFRPFLLFYYLSSNILYYYCITAYCYVAMVDTALFLDKSYNRKDQYFWKNIFWEDNDINNCLGIINTYINCTSKNDLYISLIYQTLNIQSERKKMRFYKI